MKLYLRNSYGCTDALFVNGVVSGCRVVDDCCRRLRSHVRVVGSLARLVVAVVYRWQLLWFCEVFHKYRNVFGQFVCGVEGPNFLSYKLLFQLSVASNKFS